MTSSDALNELSPIEVLHGSAIKGREIEPCQQRMLDYPLEVRNQKVMTLWRMDKAEERDRAEDAAANVRAAALQDAAAYVEQFLGFDRLAGEIRGLVNERVVTTDPGIEALRLARKWEERGVIVTIERESPAPLAMGNHHAVVRTWPKRAREA